MAIKLGMEAVLKYKVGGQAGGGTWTALGNTRDVTLSLEAGEADVTTRANAGWRATVGGQECVIVDLLFRMLQPAELAAAMGFPAEYAWPKAKRDAVRLIGNAVHVAVARALVEASLPRQRAGGSKKRRAAA